MVALVEFPMKWVNLSLAIGVIASALTGSTVAEESGDARNGLALAQRVCAECHAVRDGQRASPKAQAPSFTTVANTPGMNAMALEVWFQTPHPTMPNLMLTNEQSDDVISYILSLRKR